METTHILAAFHSALTALAPGWSIEDSHLRGPRGSSIAFNPLHESDPAHVDVSFAFASGARVTDCVVGLGQTTAEQALSAARLWGSTTATALLELLLSGTGEFADHYRAEDAHGFTGWHTIAGGIIGYGLDRSPQILQDWLCEHPPLPLLAAALSSSLRGSPGPHGVKLFFGGDGVSEVRLDGEVHEAATAAVRQLAWPRLEPPGFVRTFFVLVHPA